MIIALDFDGTLVENHPDFPQIGADNGALPWLLLGAQLGATYVLNTCRTDDVEADDWAYEMAWEWLQQHVADQLDVEHPDFDAHKVRAQLYIDDKALGAPLKIGTNGRPCIDWDVAGPALIAAIKARL